MHYYQFNIGDYKSHTEHLEPIEDIAYRRMIDYCFLHEKGLPKTTDEIARLIRMRTHCDSIETVLNEFFKFDKSTKTWINKRIKSEINDYNQKSEKAKKSAEARWHKGLDDANALRTQSERNAKHKPLNNNHKPITNNQLKDNVLSNDNTGKTSGEVSPKPDKIPYKKIVDLWNEFAEENKLPKVVKVTDALKSQIRQRWNEDLPKVTNWQNYFEFMTGSDFLMGRTQPSNGLGKYWH